MSTNSLGFVRTELLAPRPAPASERSAIGWIRSNLFATPKDTALTILAIALLV